MSPVLFTYGGGRNSKAALAEMVRRGERVDLIIFSDPGAEDPRTYEDLVAFDAWVVAHGYPAITRVRYRTEGGRELTIEEDCRERHTLPAIAFGWKTCSDKWKQRPQHAFVKTWAPAVDAWGRCEPVTKIIGYHALELSRVGAAIEDDARAHGVEMAGLGRRFSWRDVKADTKDTQLAPPCECFDAGSDDDEEEG